MTTENNDDEKVGVDKRKMEELDQVVKDHDLPIQGDESLFGEGVNRVAKFSDEQLLLWKDSLEKMFPTLPDGFLKQTLDMYKYNPDIFDKVVEMDKKEKFKDRVQDEFKFPENSDTVEIKSS